MKAKDILKWLNTETVKAPNVRKPCDKLRYCPYGPIVELYPIGMENSKLTCPLFGHDCPVHYTIERFDRRKFRHHHEIIH